MTAPMTVDATALNTHDLLIAFSRALAPHCGDVLLIRADNSASGWFPWHDVDIDDVPFAVRVGFGGRFYVLALDFDTKGYGPDAADEDSRIAMGLLGAAGIASILVESGPAGGRHVLATIRGGLEPEWARRIVRGLQRLGLRSLDPTPAWNWHGSAIVHPEPSTRGADAQRCWISLLTRL
jgi:hypothetical protein